MPINDPIRGKKIAPRSLAFEGSVRAGTGTTTYQGAISSTQITNVVTATDYRDIARAASSGAAASMDAEYRAKVYADEWHNAFLWQIDDTNQPYSFTFGVYEPVEFPLEIIRGSHCANGAGSGFGFKPPHDLHGIYHIGGYFTIQHAAIDAVVRVRLAAFVGAAASLQVAQVDDDMSGDGAAAQRDVCIPWTWCGYLDGTDAFNLRIMITGGAAGADYTVTPSVSIGGYIYGYRVACYGLKTTDNDSSINDPIAGYFINTV